MNFLKKLWEKIKGLTQKPLASDHPATDSNEHKYNPDAVVTAATKIKVVAAIMIVGFAGYVANWIQEPAQISTDVFNLPTMQSETQTQSQQLTQAVTQQTQSEQIAALPTETQTPTDLAPPPVPEQIYNAAATPAETLHYSAESYAPSLGSLDEVSASASRAMAADQALAAAQAQAAMTKGKLASSGPEDYLYAGLFGIILFLNRKKLTKFRM